MAAHGSGNVLRYRWGDHTGTGSSKCGRCPFVVSHCERIQIHRQIVPRHGLGSRGNRGHRTRIDTQRRVQSRCLGVEDRHLFDQRVVAADELIEREA